MNFMIYMQTLAVFDNTKSLVLDSYYSITHRWCATFLTLGSEGYSSWVVVCVTFFSPRVQVVPMNSAQQASNF